MKPEPIISPFLWRKQPSQINTRDLVVSSTLRAASTKKVQQDRAAGVDCSTIRGLSKKSEATSLSAEVLRDRHGGAYGKASGSTKPMSNAAKLRAALTASATPMSSAELSVATGIRMPVVPALLQYDLSADRVRIIRRKRPYRYEMLKPCLMANK
jgi:hypothetical protein